jgi:imidazolonepropionase-like amidohydrolase
MGAALQSLGAMIRTFLSAAALSLIAAPAAAETVQLRAGHLIDPGTGSVTHNRELIITDGKIVSDQPWRGARADGRLIDWSGKWVLPGLIDLHTHIADGYGQGEDPAEPLTHSEGATILKGAEMARITLHSGFTTVRDVGVYRGLTDVALRNAVAAGEVEGPRMIVAGGYITIPGGGGAVTGAKPGTVIGPEFRIGEVKGPEQARERVKAIIGGGADFHQTDRHRRRAGDRQRAGRARADAAGNESRLRPGQGAGQILHSPCPWRRGHQGGDPRWRAHHRARLAAR